MMLSPHVSCPALPVCASHHFWSSAPRTVMAPPGTFPPARWLSALPVFSTVSGTQQRRQATQHISRGAAGSDAASVAEEIGRRAAERVKAAEPLSEDDWGEPTDERDRRSPSRPSTSGRDRPPPPSGSPVPGQRGNAPRRASSALNSAERSPAQNGSEVGGGGGDGRARRYLDRIAGLKAVPEDFNRCVLTHQTSCAVDARPSHERPAASNALPDLSVDNIKALWRSRDMLQDDWMAPGPSAGVDGTTVGASGGTGQVSTAAPDAAGHSAQTSPDGMSAATDKGSVEPEQGEKTPLASWLGDYGCC